MASIEFVPEIPAWLPDDTEESVLGTEWHQEATGATALMLRAEADRRGTGWGACEHGDLEERDRQLEAELQELRQERDRPGGNASGG